MRLRLLAKVSEPVKNCLDSVLVRIGSSEMISLVSGLNKLLLALRNWSANFFLVGGYNTSTVNYIITLNYFLITLR